MSKTGPKSTEQLSNKTRTYWVNCPCRGCHRNLKEDILEKEAECVGKSLLDRASVHSLRDLPFENCSFEGELNIVSKVCL